MTVGSDKCVYDRRFTGIRATYDSKLGNIFECLSFVVDNGEVFDHFVEQIAGTVAIDSRHGIGIAKPELVKFGHIVDPIV